jgi:lipoic acid synthetase
LTLGQYLQPDQMRFLPVVRYLEPAEFDELGDLARRMGFAQVASGPFVRSSYHARDMAVALTPDTDPEADSDLGKAVND